MTDTQSESSYIREITDYFCNLAGKVAIISSEETQLLMKWKREGVPKQDVLLGIKRAFETGSRPAMMRISGCSRFVEERFYKSRLKTAASQTGLSKRPRETGVHSAVGRISLKMGEAAAKAEDASVRECLKRAAGALAGFAGEGEDIGGFAEKLRRRMCKDLLAGFDPALTSRIESRAREMVDSGRSFINEDEKNRVLTACMDDLIMREAGLAGLFSHSNEAEEDEKLR